jgi:hypothetical protein
MTEPVKGYAIKHPITGLVAGTINSNRHDSWQAYGADSPLAIRRFKDLGICCVPVEFYEVEESPAE